MSKEIPYINSDSKHTTLISNPNYISHCKETKTDIRYLYSFRKTIKIGQIICFFKKVVNSSPRNCPNVYEVPKAYPDRPAESHERLFRFREFF